MRTLDVSTFGSPSPMLDQERRRTHAVAFDDPELALAAVGGLREAGFVVLDAHTPFPVHGMEEALGLPDTRLGYGTLVGGLIGLTIGLGFQMWTHAVDWPLNIGGKSNIAWPALMPITFETTVLLAAFATVGTLFAASGLFPGVGVHAPKRQPMPTVTDNSFVLLISESDGSFSSDRFHACCKELGAVEVQDAWRVE